MQYNHYKGVGTGTPKVEWHNIHIQRIDEKFEHYLFILCMIYYTIYIRLGASGITANLYCNCVHLEGCVICCIYICGNIWTTQYDINYTVYDKTIISMVLILDGCSFHYAHTWSKSGFSICWRHLVTSKESSNPIFFSEKDLVFIIRAQREMSNHLI